jgi:hypothetical protein
MKHSLVFTLVIAQATSSGVSSTCLDATGMLADARAVEYTAAHGRAGGGCSCWSVHEWQEVGWAVLTWVADA